MMMMMMILPACNEHREWGFMFPYTCNPQRLVRGRVANCPGWPGTAPVLVLQVPCLRKLSPRQSGGSTELEEHKISKGCSLHVFEEEDYLFKLLIKILTQ